MPWHLWVNRQHCTHPLLVQSTPLLAVFRQRLDYISADGAPELGVLPIRKAGFAADDSPDTTRNSLVVQLRQWIVRVVKPFKRQCQALVMSNWGLLQREPSLQCRLMPDFQKQDSKLEEGHLWFYISLRLC